MAKKGEFGEPYDLDEEEPDILFLRDGTGDILDEACDCPQCGALADFLRRAVPCVNELDGIGFEPGAVGQVLQIAMQLARTEPGDPAVRGLVSTLRTSAAILEIEVDDG